MVHTTPQSSTRVCGMTPSTRYKRGLLLQSSQGSAAAAGKESGRIILVRPVEPSRACSMLRRTAGCHPIARCSSPLACA